MPAGWSFGSKFDLRYDSFEWSLRSRFGVYDRFCVNVRLGFYYFCVELFTLFMRTPCKAAISLSRPSISRRLFLVLYLMFFLAWFLSGSTLWDEECGLAEWDSEELTRGLRPVTEDALSFWKRAVIIYWHPRWSTMALWFICCLN